MVVCQSGAMRALLISHPAFLLHMHEDWHPERPERVPAAVEGARNAKAPLIELEAEEIDRELLAAVHPVEYQTAIERFCAAGGGHLDGDTYANARSWEAAIRAAGAGPQAVAALMEGVAEMAFLAVRPPGHHALESQAMGFCLFNNVAVTAQMLAELGNRVAIVDWDVHHGNGTQDLFNTDGRVLYISTHQYPFYPGSGWLDETGYGPGEGTTLNIPFPAYTGGDAYLAAFDRVVEPVLRQFEPDWILVSAGYDAREEDPLADGMLRAGDYQSMAYRLKGLVPAQRTLFFLEGGYDLAAIRTSVTATIDGAMGEAPTDHLPVQSQPGAWRIVDLAAKSAGRFWEIG